MNSSRVSLWLAAGIDACTSVKVPPYLVHQIGIANVQRLAWTIMHDWRN